MYYFSNVRRGNIQPNNIWICLTSYKEAVLITPCWWFFVIIYTSRTKFLKLCHHDSPNFKAGSFYMILS